MSSMKKNILAVALVAGLGLAGGAAAYTYGTNGNDPSSGPGATDGDTALGDAENVAYQMLVSTNGYDYQLTEGLVFDIEVDDNAVAHTDGFTVRVALNKRCSPHNAETNPISPISNVGVCADTDAGHDDAKFDSSAPPIAGDLVLDGAIDPDWNVTFDGFSDNDTVATFRIEPTSPTPIGPGTGTITLTWNNARLTSLNEFAATPGAKVDAEFWMVNTQNDARFVGSTMSRTILERVETLDLCANSEGAEKDKYIDVADNFNEDQIPKTRFSWDGKLGSAEDATGGSLYSPGDYGSQVINLGTVILTSDGAGNFMWWGTDVFTTTIVAGDGTDGDGADEWLAFDNGAAPLDDVYLVYGSCTSGQIVDQGQITGGTVTFSYTAADIETYAPGFINVLGGPDRYLTVCAFVDTDVQIDDHNNHVSTTFTRSGAVPTPPFEDSHNDDVCDLLPLRYNGSTMEIFTINPGSNTTQRSFVRLTNRSATAGFVSLEGIDNNGDRGASQVRVWVPAGASVQLDSADLENGTNGAVGAWGTGAGKWRAVVTAEFPGLVATSLVNTSGDRTLQNMTDSDTRGEQHGRDWQEGTFASEPSERSSDFTQEWAPDFHGNGSETGVPGGPNGSDGPSGGQTEADGNPGL